MEFGGSYINLGVAEQYRSHSRVLRVPRKRNSDRRHSADPRVALGEPMMYESARSNKFSARLHELCDHRVEPSARLSSLTPRYATLYNGPRTSVQYGDRALLATVEDVPMICGRVLARPVVTARAHRNRGRTEPQQPLMSRTHPKRTMHPDNRSNETENEKRTETGESNNRRTEASPTRGSNGLVESFAGPGEVRE